MRLRSQLAPLGLAGLALVVGLWFALRAPQPATVAPRPAVAPDVASQAEPFELHAPPAAQAARGSAVEAAAPAAEADAPRPGVDLRVLSSSGLILPTFDWREPGGEWQRVDLDHDGMARGVPPVACDVRAPGHAAAALEPGQSEVVLDPDVLFTLHAVDLRACVREIDVDDPFLLESQRGTEADTRRPRLGVWGFVSESAWAVAVSAEAVVRELPGPELRIVLYRRDGRRSDVALNATTGLRGTWEVPCDETGSIAPLRVTVVRPDELGEGTVDVGVGRTGDTYQDSKREAHAWGSVVHYPVGSWGPKLELAAGEDQVEFEAIPLHLPHAVVVQDPVSKAYGRELFVHDGSPRSVTLRPPLRVRGRLLDVRDDKALARAALRWQCRVGEERIFGWHAEALRAVLAADGSFELPGPTTPPGNPSMPLEPPGTLWMRIESPGFDPLELEREIGALRVIDLGDLRLVAREPELVLAPGHGLTPAQVDWHEFEIAGQPERSWEVRWGRLADDGSLELHLGERRIDPNDSAPDLVAARALILYTNDESVPVRAFQRDARGSWVAVEMRRHVLEFRVEPSAGARDWWIGWEWQGLFGVCEGFSRPAAGEALHVVLSAPADGARLAWASREGGRSGFLVPDELAPLVDPMPLLVLR